MAASCLSSGGRWAAHARVCADAVPMARSVSTATRWASSSCKQPFHIHFVGCNGVPSACYSPLLERIGVASTSYTEVCTLAGGDWHAPINRIVADVAAAKQRVGPDVEVVGFGHSMGGAMLYAASTRSTDTMSRLLVFDPPMFRPTLRALMLALQVTGLFEWHPLVRAARKRPTSFASRKEAEAFVASRRLYASFHPDILAAFLARGLVEDGSVAGEGGQGRTAFLFTPDNEADIFRSTPSDLHTSAGGPWGRGMGQYAPSHCESGVFMYSTRHEFNAKANVDWLRGALCATGGVAGAAAAEGGRPFFFDGRDVGHFHPLTDPDETAHWVREWLQS